MIRQKEKKSLVSTQPTRCVNQTVNSKPVMSNIGNPNPAKANSELEIRSTFPHDCKKEW